MGDGGRGTLEGEREGEKYDYEVLDRRCRRSPCTNSVKTNPLRMITEYGTEEWEAMYRKTGSKEREKRTDQPSHRPFRLTAARARDRSRHDRAKDGETN